MPQITSRDHLLLRGMEGLVGLYNDNLIQGLCAEVQRYIAATNSMSDAGRHVGEDEREAFAQEYWEKAVSDQRLSALLEKISGFLEIFFSGQNPLEQANHFVQPAEGERWSVWRFQTFRPIQIDLDQIIFFTRFMVGLHEAILDKAFTQFVVLKREVTESYANEIEPGGITKITRRPRETHRRYTVSAHAEFGLQLLEWFPEPEPFNVIQDIETGEFATFIQLFRAILVNFHIQYGGFEKLSTCTHCGKLIFKRRLRKEPTCSQYCRSRKSYNEDLDRTRCRHRQLGFMANAKAKVLKIKPESLTKADCLGCLIQDVSAIRFGDCPIFRERNQAFVEAYEKVKGKHS